MAIEAKVAIRRNVAAAVGEVDGPTIAVFDAFGGAGHLYAAIWKDAATIYVGCDLKWWRDSRTMFVADNRRVMRAINLKQFNVFDFDAYGSPWEQCLILAARRPVAQGERIGIVITEGGGISYRANSLPTATKILAGLTGKLVGMGRERDRVITMALNGLARRMRCKIEKRWEAKGKTGTAMAYVGVVLVGL